MIARIFTAALAAAGLMAAGAASAQDYPTKPIKFIVGFAPGGPSDVLGRLIGQKMGQILGQTIIVDNRPGAGGTIGARAAAESDPDGYTLLFGNTSTLVIGPKVYKNPGYDPAKAFAAVALVGTTDDILVVNPKVAAKTVKELIALAKAAPGKLNYSSPGVGTPPHLAGESLKLQAGIDVVHVPYKGGGPSIQAVIAGDVQYTFENPSVSLPLVRAGKVRALATTGAARMGETPDVPTMVESGLAGFVAVSFTGIAAPAKTPPAIVKKLNAAANQALNSPDVKATLTRLAVEEHLGSAEDFAKFLAQQRDYWGRAIEAAQIKTK